MTFSCHNWVINPESDWFQAWKLEVFKEKINRSIGPIVFQSNFSDEGFVPSFELLEELRWEFMSLSEIKLICSCLEDFLKKIVLFREFLHLNWHFLDLTDMNFPLYTEFVDKFSVKLRLVLVTKLLIVKVLLDCSKVSVFIGKFWEIDLIGVFKIIGLNGRIVNLDRIVDLFRQTKRKLFKLIFKGFSICWFAIIIWFHWTNFMLAFFLILWLILLNALFFFCYLLFLKVMFPLLIFG